MKTLKNKKLLENFSLFCEKNSNLRFWQALRNWSGFEFILVSNKRSNNDLQDTFYFEGKNK